MILNSALKYSDDRGTITTIELPVACRYNHELTYKSPNKVKQAVELMAVYYRRELGFDFPCYGAESSLDDKNRMFVITRTDPWYHKMNQGLLAIGFCQFTKGYYNNIDPAIWMLSNIWIHPLFRGKGELQQEWRRFCDIFPPFTVQRPISKTMKAFLKDKAAGETITLDENKRSVPLYHYRGVAEGPLYVVDKDPISIRFDDNCLTEYLSFEQGLKMLRRYGSQAISLIDNPDIKTTLGIESHVVPKEKPIWKNNDLILVYDKKLQFNPFNLHHVKCD